MGTRYWLRYVRDDLFRFSVFWYRNVDGYIATAQQSGSHWLSNLISTALCEEYDIPRPKHIQDKVIIGHPRVAANYPQIPRLVRTHHTPGPIVHSAPFRAVFQYPKYVILVRDIRASLVSKYEKTIVPKSQGRGSALPFSRYLRDHRMFGREDKWDLYKRISFFNSWGRIAETMPAQTCIVHYEALRNDTPYQLERIWRFLELPVSSADLFQNAANLCTKERMAEREMPGRALDMVRSDDRDPVAWFDDDDRQHFSDTCRHFLKYDFGYAFDDWSSAKSEPATFSRRAA